MQTKKKTKNGNRKSETDGVLRLAVDEVLFRCQKQSGITMSLQIFLDRVYFSMIDHAKSATFDLLAKTTPPNGFLQGKTPWLKVLPRLRASDKVDTQRVRLFLVALFDQLPGGLLGNLDIYIKVAEQFFYHREPLGPERVGFDRKIFMFNECQYLVIFCKIHTFSTLTIAPEIKRTTKRFPLYSPLSIDGLFYLAAKIAVTNGILAEKAKDFLADLLESQTLTSKAIEPCTMRILAKHAPFLYRLADKFIGGHRRKRRAHPARTVPTIAHYRIHWSSDMERETGQRCSLAAKANYSLDHCFRAEIFAKFREALVSTSEELLLLPVETNKNAEEIENLNEVAAMFKASNKNAEEIEILNKINAIYKAITQNVEKIENMNKINAIYQAIIQLQNNLSHLCDTVEDLAFGSPFFTNLHEIAEEFGPETHGKVVTFDPLGIDSEVDPRIFESITFFSPGFRRSIKDAS